MTVDDSVDLCTIQFTRVLYRPAILLAHPALTTPLLISLRIQLYIALVDPPKGA
jgi:hypothetical protein